MEPGTAKTLRILGIIATVLFTLAACGILLLLSICAGLNRPNPSSDATGFFIGSLVVLLAGIWIIIALARGLMRSSPQTLDIASAGTIPPPPPASLMEPLLVSREGQLAIDLVVFALCGSLIFSIASWVLNQRYVQAARSVTQPRWLLVQITVFALYNLPYVILLYGFLVKAARWTFYYAIATPAALLLITLFNLATMSSIYMHSSRLLLMTGISAAIEIAILALAWRAALKNGIKPPSSSLVVAGVVALVYFVIVRNVTTALYRAFWR